MKRNHISQRVPSSPCPTRCCPCSRPALRLSGSSSILIACVVARSMLAPLQRPVRCAARRSRRVHSRYIRHLGDLPWKGRIGHLDLQIRRFRCSALRCPRRIFAERLPAVAPCRESAHRPPRRGPASAGPGCRAVKPGSRLASRLAMPVSGDTLLRLIRAVPIEPAPPARVIGIDDWAWRRGQRYGTIIVDLERATGRSTCCPTARPRPSRPG